jgi:hypothetical protein
MLMAHAHSFNSFFLTSPHPIFFFPFPYCWRCRSWRLAYVSVAKGAQRVRKLKTCFSGLEIRGGNKDTFGIWDWVFNLLRDAAHGFRLCQHGSALSKYRLTVIKVRHSSMARLITQSKHNNVLYVILLYYIRRAKCFDSPESSSGPQGSDPHNKWDNALWDPQRLQSIV